MLTCIIIEDQTPAQRILQKYIGGVEGLTLKETFSDALAARSFLEQYAVDLVFLDINLPRQSGMEFLRTSIKHPLTILTTAYSEFALESYRYHVVDYLLKPFSFERFSQAIEKVLTLTRSIHQVAETHDNRHLLIKTSCDLVRVDQGDIIFIRSDSDYTEVVTATEKYLTSDALKVWKAKLSDDFRQVHKSYIVNIAHLRKIAHNRVHLSKELVVPIGRAYKKEFMEGVVS